MAMAELLAELERDAAGQVEALLSEADAEAERIASECAARLAARRAARLGEEEARLADDTARELRTTRRESSMVLLAARRRAIDRLLAAASARLGEPDWIERSAAGLDARLSAALLLAGDSAPTVIAEPALAERLRASPALAAAARVEALAGCGAGILVRAHGGAVDIDDLWRGRLDRLRPALEVDLANALAAEIR